MEKEIQQLEERLREHRAVDGVRSLTVNVLHTFEEAERAVIIEALERLAERIARIDSESYREIARDLLREGGY